MLEWKYYQHKVALKLVEPIPKGGENFEISLYISKSVSILCTESHSSATKMFIEDSDYYFFFIIFTNVTAIFGANVSR